MYPCVLFDCDGVLVDTETIWFNLITKMLRERGLAFNEVKPERLIGESINNCVDFIERDLAVSLDRAFIREFRALVTNLSPHEFKPVPGATDVLRVLEQTPSVRFGVVSNSPLSQVKRVLEGANLARFFSEGEFVTGPEVGAFKPDPRLYQVAAHRFHVLSNDCLVVEDSPSGIASARKAGAFVLRLSTGSHSTEAMPFEDVQTVEQLADLLRYL